MAILPLSPRGCCSSGPAANAIRGAQTVPSFQVMESPLWEPVYDVVRETSTPGPARGSRKFSVTDSVFKSDRATIQIQ
jgi:hypothetical protein